MLNHGACVLSVLDDLRQVLPNDDIRDADASEVPFASLVTYCPRGDSVVICKSQTLMWQVKENRVAGTAETAAFGLATLRIIVACPGKLSDDGDATW